MRGLVLGSPWFAGLAVLACASPARADHPPDPFAREYEVPAARDVGAAAGQFRAIGSGLLAYGRPGPSLGLHGTLELMTFAYLGVRASLESTLLRPDGDPMLLAGKVGPSLHLLPYRRFDVSLFFEGGVAGVDLTGSATAMPILSPGGTLEIGSRPGPSSAARPTSTGASTARPASRTATSASSAWAGWESRCEAGGRPRPRRRPRRPLRGGAPARARRGAGARADCAPAGRARRQGRVVAYARRLLVDHGWHMMVGFYGNLFALMRRAGVDPARAMVSMAGESHCYEPFDRAIHTMSSEGGRRAVAERFAV